MAITFKQFHTFVSMDTEPTDEQITEIFGVFSGNADKKVDDLKKKREEMTAAQKAERARKDAAFRAAKEKAEGRAPKPEPEQGSGTARAKQARERGMEYGWVGESKSSSLSRQVHDSLNNAKDNESFKKGGGLYGKDAFAIAQDLVELDAALEKHTPTQLVKHVKTWMAANDLT